jgi:hypothetical protein
VQSSKNRGKNGVRIVRRSNYTIVSLSYYNYLLLYASSLFSVGLLFFLSLFYLFLHAFFLSFPFFAFYCILFFFYRLTFLILKKSI